MVEGQAAGLDRRQGRLAAADRRGAVEAMTFWAFWAYQGIVWTRAWRDTVAFLKAHVLVGLVIAVVTALVMGRVSADIGEAFNVRVAICAAVAAAVFVAFCVLGWNLMTAPWRLYEEQAARLRAFERRPDVTKLVQQRHHGVGLRNEPLKKPMQDEEQLSLWQARLRSGRTRRPPSWRSARARSRRRRSASSTRTRLGCSPASPPCRTPRWRC